VIAAAAAAATPTPLWLQLFSTAFLLLMPFGVALGLRYQMRTGRYVGNWSAEKAPRMRVAMWGCVALELWSIWLMAGFWF
jgi:hypothetical protein